MLSRASVPNNVLLTGCTCRFFLRDSKRTVANDYGYSVVIDCCFTAKLFIEHICLLCCAQLRKGLPSLRLKFIDSLKYLSFVRKSP